MFSALLFSQLASANDVLILPFQVEGMTNIHWTPHLEHSLMDQLSLHRIAHVSPNQTIKVSHWDPFYCQGGWARQLASY